jgi:hypothetical protein
VLVAAPNRQDFFVGLEPLTATKTLIGITGATSARQADLGIWLRDKQKRMNSAISRDCLAHTDTFRRLSVDCFRVCLAVSSLTDSYTPRLYPLCAWDRTWSVRVGEWSSGSMATTSLRARLLLVEPGLFYFK